MQVADVCALTIQWVGGKAGQTEKARGRGRAPRGGKPKLRRATSRLNRENPGEMASWVSKHQWRTSVAHTWTASSRAGVGEVWDKKQSFQSPQGKGRYWAVH